uniref:guanylin n=1 Tax=Euleptes europaea TaxID=460621 RepID=UPI00253F6B3E|nr:guanylin [Euleptes europaea]
MNTLLTVSLCLCALAVLSEGVTVRVAEYSFPLQSVKKLKYLPRAPPTRIRNAVNMCNNPNLPTEFESICVRPNSQQLLKQLQAIARDSEACEICANVACSGC